MGNKYKNRRDFFNTLLNRADEAAEETAVADAPGIPIKEAPPGSDKNFERFSRKELTGRQYAPLLEPEDQGHVANRVTSVTSGLTAYSGTWGDAEVAHLLRRTGFGVKGADIATLKAMTISNAVDAVLNITTTPVSPSATPLNYYNNINGAADSSSVAYGASWTGTNLTFGSTSNDGTVDAYRQNALQAWHWGLWLNGDYTIREKMVQFWFHFIPVDFGDVRNTVYNGATLSHEYMKLLRDNAAGNFFTLIKAIAKNPAMLVFLSGQYSTASAPNENFGRELMELFTLGKVPTQNYDEFDIKAAAKVFSGWRVISTTTPAGNPFQQAQPFTVDMVLSAHNTSNKYFSSNFGSASTATVTGGTTVTTAKAEFDAFFNMLFTQQATTIAKYVVRRLYRYFVYYDIDATTETNIIGPLATTLTTGTSTTNAWDILPVLQQLFKSQHFYDVANRGVMIKSPTNLLTGVIKHFGINTTTTNSATAPANNLLQNQYTVWKYLNDYCNNNLEESVGLVPNVSGYKAWYQSPGYYQNWINTNTIQKRTSFIASLLSTNGLNTGGNLYLKIDVIAFMNNFTSTVQSAPDLLTAAMVSLLLTQDPGQTVRDAWMTANLLGNQTTYSYWTIAWTNYTGTPTNSTYLSTVKTRLTNLISAIIQSAEYQLM